MSKTKTRKTELGSIIIGGITGRDGYIIGQALAIGIETISSLPESRQERSNCEDMRKLFAALFSEEMREILTDSARFHLNPDAAREQMARYRASAPASSLFAKATTPAGKKIARGALARAQAAGLVTADLANAVK